VKKRRDATPALLLREILEVTPQYHLPRSTCNRVSGFDPASGICWDFRNPGDNRWRCECPACKAEAKKKDIIAFGRCRSGQRWFWAAVRFSSDGQENERHGWAETEEAAVTAAMWAVQHEVRGLRRWQKAHMFQAIASDKLKELNAAKRAARPAPDTSDAIRPQRRKQEAPVSLAELKAEMAAAHPDRGGSSAAFIAAKERYDAARRQMRR
jgi:hypothetical protein